jgi:cytochrome b561
VTRTTLIRTDRYSWGSIWLHWATAALVLVNLTLGLFHESLLDGIKWVIPIHKSIGITVLALTLLRLGWRLTHRPPPLPVDMTGWERAAAKVVHWAFYALLLALPLTGWMLSSNPARLRPMAWFWLFPIPPLPISGGMAKLGHNLHGIIGYAMLALVVLHIAAALRHHLLLRDSVLSRMAPGLNRNG